LVLGEGEQRVGSLACGFACGGGVAGVLGGELDEARQGGAAGLGREGGLADLGEVCECLELIAEAGGPCDVEQFREREGVTACDAEEPAFRCDEVEQEGVVVECVWFGRDHVPNFMNGLTRHKGRGV